MSLDFIVHNAGLIAAQALLVALPGAGVPAWMRRTAGDAWALILPLSLGVVVAAIALLPGVADGLTWLALLAIPPLAAVGLGWAMRGARLWLAPLAAVLLAVAWIYPDVLIGQVCGLALGVFSCVTLGRLLAGVAPSRLLELGIVVMAVLDIILVFSQSLDQPNATLVAAAPGAGLPQLQSVGLGSVTMGYGDLFVAGVLGGVLAVQGVRAWPVALLTLACSVVWDLLFLVRDSIPATVPVAMALVISLGWRASRRAGGPRRIGLRPPQVREPA